MSDLSDLASDVSKDLPAQVRKVIDAAMAAGWQLNKPGMTLCLRLNHPTDDLAEPVYVSWVIGRTATGRLSFRFDSCGTRGLVPLSGADLLEYLQDPTVIYKTDEDIAQEAQRATEKALEDTPPWDTRKSLMTNLQATLGATVLKVQKVAAKDIQAQAQANPAIPSRVKPLRVNAPALRVQAPKV